MKSREEFKTDKEYKEYLKYYFAGLAMQGLLAKEGVWSSDEILAKRSVEIADELLKQLEQ